MSSAVERVELAAGYTIARLINGCWQLSAGHQRDGHDPERVIAAWRRLAEAGFTTFDCADIYTGVEELLGRFLTDWRAGGGAPAAIQIHTKYVPDAGELAALSRASVESVIDRSLRRLGVERLDLVQFSWWDYAVPGYVEVSGWLDELRRAGKIRLVGATNFDVPHLGEILDAGVPIAAHQVQYSLLDRRPENGMVDLCRRHGVRLLTYGSLAGGFLSERWLNAGEPENPSNRSLVKYRLIIDELGGWERFQELLAVVVRIAGERGLTVGNVAARWVLEQPGVGAVIAGARNDDHLEENLRLFETSLGTEAHAALRAVLARAAGPRGDTFSLERDPHGPHSAIMWKNLNRGGRWV